MNATSSTDRMKTLILADLFEKFYFQPADAQELKVPAKWRDAIAADLFSLPTLVNDAVAELIVEGFVERQGAAIVLSVAAVGFCEYCTTTGCSVCGDRRPQ